MLIFASAYILCALAQLEPGQAGPSPAVARPAPAPIPSSPTLLHLPAGTPLEVELVDTLSSSTSKLADRFTIRLVTAISRDGIDVVAAGATGQGEVIDAARAGMGGKQGKLIISARYLDLNGRHVRVHGMTLAFSGKSHVNLATGVLLAPYVGMGAVLIQGGEIQIPAGSRATVRLAEDVDLPTSVESKGELK